MTGAPRRRGFTLIELLVVIAIIVVLMAILFPVFSKVREKARQTKCRSSLHQLAVALKQYRTDHGKYPGLPYYDVVAGRYMGGFSTLFPDYIDSTDLLICPEDQIALSLKGQVKQIVYSSYNGRPTDPAGGNWALAEVYFNHNGYDYSGAPGSAITSTGIDNLGLDEASYRAVVMQELSSKGLRWRAAPRLKNASAPDNTIISHCVHHRRSARGQTENEMDFVVRLGGDVGPVKHVHMESDPDGAGPKIAPWISQTQ